MERAILAGPHSYEGLFSRDAVGKATILRRKLRAFAIIVTTRKGSPTSLALFPARYRESGEAWTLTLGKRSQPRGASALMLSRSRVSKRNESRGRRIDLVAIASFTNVSLRQSRPPFSQWQTHHGTSRKRSEKPCPTTQTCYCSHERCSKLWHPHSPISSKQSSII